MERLRLSSKLSWLDRPVDREDLTLWAAKDSYHLKSLGERVRCWICYRSSMVSWGRLIACQGAGSCHSHYALMPWKLDDKMVINNSRDRCFFCGEAGFNYYRNNRVCLRCKRTDDFSPSIDDVVLVIQDEAREVLRASGVLEPGGGPTWGKAKLPMPLEPHVDLDRRAYKNRMKSYRNYEMNKINVGRKPEIDYRRFKGNK